MAQVFETSAGGDIGGAKRSGIILVDAPFVSGYRPTSTSVPSSMSGAWPQPITGGLAVAQPFNNPTVSTSGTEKGSFPYIPTSTASLIAITGTPMLSTMYQVAAVAFDSNSGGLFIWNPVSSAWNNLKSSAGTSLVFTSSST